MLVWVSAYVKIPQMLNKVDIIDIMESEFLHF